MCLNYDGKFGLNNMNNYFQTANKKGNAVLGKEWSYKSGVPILFNETKCFPILHNNLKGHIVDIVKYADRITFTVDVEMNLTEIEGKIKVIIPNSNSEKIIHGIFYTAITRAKKRLKIYWSAETMEKIVKSFSVDETEKPGNCEIKIRNIKFAEFCRIQKKFKYPQTGFITSGLSEGFIAPAFDFKIVSDIFSPPPRSRHTAPSP